MKSKSHYFLTAPCMYKVDSVDIFFYELSYPASIKGH